jgi:hypothetical protein
MLRYIIISGYNYITALSILLQHIHTYHLYFIPEGVVETSQTFLTHSCILPKWLSYDKYSRHDRQSIAVWLQPITGVSAVNPFVFYNIHERQGEVLFFCSVPVTRQDKRID